MTRDEAIHKIEYSKKAYQMLIDEKVQEGDVVGHGIKGEWKADTPIIDAYKDMLNACEMSIKALKQYGALQEIRQEIDNHCSDNRDRNDGLYIAMKIIDKYIESEG